MSIINGYKVTSNHRTGLYPANVRVKNPDGVLVACVAAPRGDVLRHIRFNPMSEERKTFVAQLCENGVDPLTIEKILAVPKNLASRKKES